MSGSETSDAAHGAHQKTMLKRFDRIFHTSPLPRAILRAMKPPAVEHPLQQISLPDSDPSHTLLPAHPQYHHPKPAPQPTHMEIRDGPKTKRRRTAEEDAIKTTISSADGLSMDSINNSGLSQEEAPEPIPLQKKNYEALPDDSYHASTPTLSGSTIQPRLSNIEVVIYKRPPVHPSPDSQTKAPRTKSGESLPNGAMPVHEVSITEEVGVKGVINTKTSPQVVAEKTCPPEDQNDGMSRDHIHFDEIEAVQEHTSDSTSNITSKRPQVTTDDLNFGGKYAIPPEVLESTGSSWESGRRHSRRSITGDGKEWWVAKRSSTREVSEETKDVIAKEIDPYEFSDEE